MVADAGIPLDGIMRIQASGMALSKRLTATLDALPEIISGWDPRQAVRVDIDRMAQLVSVTVSPKWSDVVRADELASAVMLAKSAADEQYTAALDAAAEAADAHGPVAAEAPTDEMNPLLARAQAFGPTRRPVDLIEEVLASVPQDEQPSRPAESDEWIVETPVQYSLTIDGGMLTAARIDGNWASTRSVASINSALAAEIVEKKSSAANETPTPGTAGDDIVELLAALVNLSNDVGTPNGKY